MIDRSDPLDANLSRLLAGLTDASVDPESVGIPPTLAARSRAAIDRGLATARRATIRRRVTVCACAAALFAGALGLRPDVGAPTTGRFTVEAGETMRIGRDAVVSAVSPTLLDVESPEDGFRLRMPAGSALFEVQPKSAPFRVRTPACDVRGTSGRFVLRCVAAEAANGAKPAAKGQVFAIVLDGTIELDFAGGARISVCGGEIIAASDDGATDRMEMSDVPRLHARLARQEASNATLRSRMLALEAEASRRHVRGFPRFPTLHAPGAAYRTDPQTLDDVDWARAARAAVSIAEGADLSDALAEFAVLPVALLAVRPRLESPGAPGEEMVEPEVLPRLLVAIVRLLDPALSDEDAERVAAEAKETAMRSRERQSTAAPPLSRARDALLTDEEICELVARYTPPAKAALAWRLPPLAAAHLDVAPRVVALRSRAELAEAIYTSWRSGVIALDSDQEIRVHLRATRAAETLADLLERESADLGPKALRRMIDWLTSGPSMFETHDAEPAAADERATPDDKPAASMDEKPAPASPPADESADRSSIEASRRLWREIVELESLHEAAFLSLLTPMQRARYESSRPAVIVAILDE